MRTPDQIRDSAVRCFNQLAPAKYDIGQAKSEVTNNLDKHPDLINAIREELLDGWFYVGSLAEQHDQLWAKIEQQEERIRELEVENEELMKTVIAYEDK
tara:strand:+ start:2659 stop:2955 length:297 start_codon:yes stop_codon:yes gene_type:complete